LNIQVPGAETLCDAPHRKFVSQQLRALDAGIDILPGNDSDYLEPAGVEETPSMIQAIYKGIEIEMEMHQQAHEYWKCDYTLIKHPERTTTLHHADKEFPTMELAREYALQEARDAIDRDTLGK
jgi:hypothetical protein